VGGHRYIYSQLLARMAGTNLAAAAESLQLETYASGEVAVPYLGVTFLASRQGVRRADGGRILNADASVILHYLLDAGPSQPAGQFVTLAELAGPLFKQGSYSQSALQRPVVKRFQARLPELLRAAAALGGEEGGEAGLGAVSIIFDLLPHIPLQLMFYDRDEEFGARATLLLDRNATTQLEFEVLAVAVTRFVQTLTQA
jgi:hypothetical protein